MGKHPKNKLINKKLIFKVNSISAFTIVELLVVIVIIGILAAIAFISYSGISDRASVAALQSDLDNAVKQIKVFQVTNGSYPVSVTDCPNPAATNICLKASNNATYTQYNNLGNSFILEETNSSSNKTYQVKDSTSPVDKATVGQNCPTGYIPVPGSSTYNTSDFCVMKYEAKIQGNDNGDQTYSSAFVAESRPSGTPWVEVSQTNAIAEASALGTGYHLITEAEWMTIAQNVLSVPSNWSGGAVGSGYIYSGHNDNAPSGALAADASDSNGYSGETNTSGNQRRTLALTNGQVIWDFAGNVWEWTQDTIAGGQQPGIPNESDYHYKQWNSTSWLQNGLSSLSMPSSTGISGITWNSSSGIGQLFSYYGETSIYPHVFLRSGNWNSTVYAGILVLHFYNPPSNLANQVGFRVSR